MKSIIFLLGLFLLVACSHDNLTILPNSVWLYKKPLNFSFQIEDTFQKYDITYKIKYTIDYPYQNHYVKYYIVDQNDTILENLSVISLFDLKTGKYLGKKRYASSYLKESVLLKNYQFKQLGSYHLICEQYMRTDSLVGVEGVGIVLKNLN